MGRVVALFLIAFGSVLAIVGLGGGIVALTELKAGNVTIAVVFLAVLVVGVVLIVVGVSLYRQSQPLGPAWTGGTSNSGPYAPGIPHTEELDGSPYTSVYTPPVKGKHARPSSLVVSTHAKTPCEVQVTSEGWFDRLCKRMGLAVEVQAGDEAFDAACYVRSDTVEFAEAYLADPLKRAAILDLRRMGFSVIHLKDHAVAATWTGFDPLAHDHPELTADVAARLLLLARNLPEHQPEFDNRAGARRKNSQTVLWVVLALFAATIFSVFAYPPIRALDLIGRAAVVCLLGGVVFAYLAAMLLRGTSTSHYAWGGLMFGVLFLFPLGSAGSVALLNGVLDDSPAVTHNAVIVEKYTSRSKSKTHYHVRVASWRTPGATESFQIDSQSYGAIVPNTSHLAVTTRAGGLGMQWLVGKRVDARPARP